jgi:hypothetical protein
VSTFINQFLGEIYLLLKHNIYTTVGMTTNQSRLVVMDRFVENNIIDTGLGQ